MVITGSIVHSAKCRYFSYSEADFEVFRPAGRHVAPIGVKFGTEVPSSMPDFTPVGATIRVWTPKLKFLLTFDQNVEYKCPTGAYPLHDFHKTCRDCTSFQDVLLAVKISLDLLNGLWSHGGKGGWYRSPQMSKFAQNCGFRPPDAADTMNTFT